MRVIETRLLFFLTRNSGIYSVLSGALDFMQLKLSSSVEIYLVDSLRIQTN